MQPVFSSLALLGHPLHAQSEQLHDPAPVEEHIFPHLYVVESAIIEELVSEVSDRTTAGRSREERRGAENERGSGTLTSNPPWDQSLPPRSSCSGTLRRCIVQGTNRLRSRRRGSTWCRICCGRDEVENKRRGGRKSQSPKSMRMMRGSDDRPGLTSIRPESA